MSATAPTSHVTRSTASDRLSSAIDVATPSPRSAAPCHSSDYDAPTPRTRRAASVEQPAAVRDTARGAMAAPTAPVQGAHDAGDGADRATGTANGSLARYPSSAPTPYEASMASYAAEAAAASDPYAADPAAPDPIAGPTTTMAPVSGGGGWSRAWRQEFERLQLAPADLDTLARSGYSDVQLAAIAGQLAAVPVQHAGAPGPGVDAGSAASANGPVPGGATMAQASAWDSEWESRFSVLMRRKGMSEAEVRAQVASIQGQPVTSRQLEAAYAQMATALGDWDPGWQAKFGSLMDELDRPASERTQVLEQLSSGGFGDAQLAEIHRQMEQSKPAWNQEWANRFDTLGLPQEVVTQLEGSGAPAQALEQQFQRFLDAKLQYKEDGRLERLEDAKASPEEKWGVMLEGLDGEKFDKAVEQIHSRHVPGWKRALGFAANLIPGVYAAQYLTGKDWLTGEKIDRSNPLNIIGAVASGFAGFTAVRGAIGIAGSAGGLFQGLQGARMVNGAVSGGTQMAANAANQAKNASAVLSAATTGGKAGFQLKAVLGSITRFGDLGSIATASRTWGQTASFAASTMAAKQVADGTIAIDRTARATALHSLRSTGGSLSEAMRATSPARTAFEHGAAFADDVAHARSAAATFNQAGGFWTFNPLKNRATAEAAGTTTGGQGIISRIIGRGRSAPATPAVGAGPVINTGRSLDMGSRAGFAIANGTLDGVTGLRSGMSVADHARRMGINGNFRSLLQLSQGERAATGSIRAVEGIGRFGYEALHVAGRTGSSFATYAAVPIVGGAAVGMTGKQMQPMWDWVKDRKEIQAREAEARAVADQEAAELERLYAQQQAGSAPAAAQTAATPAAAADPSGVAAPATAGGEAAVYVDPATGHYVDPQTGMRADPTTGEVYDAHGQPIGNVNQPAA